MRGVLTLAIKLWIFGSPGGLQVPIFGNVSFILTLNPKWGYDTRPKGQLELLTLWQRERLGLLMEHMQIFNVLLCLVSMKEKYN
jgi:hypothetical protein